MLQALLRKDKLSRHRLIGVVVWFSLVLFFVPDWYSNPVNFDPENMPASTQNLSASERVVFQGEYRLPPAQNSVEENQEVQAAAREQARNDEDLDAKIIGDEPVVGYDLMVSPRADFTKSAQSAKQSIIDSSSAPLSSQAEDATPEPSSKTTSTKLVSRQGTYLLQLSSTKKRPYAESFVKKVKKQGYENVEIRSYKNDTIFSVIVYGFTSKSKAEKAKQKLDRIFKLQSIVRPDGR